VSTSRRLTAAEAAQIVGITPKRLRQLVAQGRITPIGKFGPVNQYDEGQIRRFAATYNHSPGRRVNPRLTSAWQEKRREALRLRRANPPA
jgi:hypothetical protein